MTGRDIAPLRNLSSEPEAMKYCMPYWRVKQKPPESCRSDAVIRPRMECTRMRASAALILWPIMNGTATLVIPLKEQISVIRTQCIPLRILLISDTDFSDGDVKE